MEFKWLTREWLGEDVGGHRCCFQVLQCDGAFVYFLFDVEVSHVDVFRSRCWTADFKHLNTALIVLMEMCGWEVDLEVGEQVPDPHDHVASTVGSNDLRFGGRLTNNSLTFGFCMHESSSKCDQ